MMRWEKEEPKETVAATRTNIQLCGKMEAKCRMICPE